MADQNIPEEYAAELEAIAKRRAIAQLLQKNSLGFQGAKSTTPVAAKTSPLAWMANAAAGYLGGEADAQGMKAQRGVKDRMTEDQNAEITALLAAPEEQQFAQAQTGRFSRTRDIAKALQDRKDKRIAAFTSAVKDVDPAIAAQTVLSDKLPGTYTPTPIQPTTFGTDPSGNPYLTEFDRKGQPTNKYAPKASTVTVGGEKQESEAAKAVGKKIPDVFEANVKAAQGAIASMESAQRISELLKNPEIVLGFGATPLAGVASLGNKLGFQGPEAAAKTQSLLSEMAQQTLANVSKLPGAITEKERPFLEMAAAGRLEYTQEAIQRLADIAQMAGHNALTELYSARKGMEASPGAAETGAAGIWPFPKGWNFAADPKKFKETGAGSNRYQYIGDTPVAPDQAAPKRRIYNPVTRRLEDKK